MDADGGGSGFTWASLLEPENLRPLKIGIGLVMLQVGCSACCGGLFADVNFAACSNGAESTRSYLTPRSCLPARRTGASGIPRALSGLESNTWVCCSGDRDNQLKALRGAIIVNVVQLVFTAISAAVDAVVQLCRVPHVIRPCPAAHGQERATILPAAVLRGNGSELCCDGLCVPCRRP